jgi:hypothetical protein
LNRTFEQALRKGYTIRAVEIERKPDEDDDWIEFVMDGPDPAIAPFRKPARSQPICLHLSRAGGPKSAKTIGGARLTVP